MSGHSKWANRKHRKQREDAKRGKMFTKLSRAIALAAREGGGDPEVNFKLRLAVENARSYNMPNDNIERAIQRGTGELDGDQTESVIYEGYGPCGVALLVESLTDNRNRTVSDIRFIFAKYDGSLGETGCVSWIFNQKGQILIENTAGDVDEDELMMFALEAGAEDVNVSDGMIEVICNPSDFQQVNEAFRKSDYEVKSAALTRVPKTTVRVEGKDAEKTLKLIEDLEDYDDVQEVYSNFDIDDSIIEALGA